MEVKYNKSGNHFTAEYILIADEQAFMEKFFIEKSITIKNLASHHEGLNVGALSQLNFHGFIRRADFSLHQSTYMITQMGKSYIDDDINHS